MRRKWWFPGCSPPSEYRSAIKIAAKADKVRKEPLRVILNGLGKDAAQIIARINGFTYVQTQFDYYTGELKEIKRIAYSDGPRAKVNCYGADDVREGVAIMWKEGVDVSITGRPVIRIWPLRFLIPTSFSAAIIVAVTNSISRARFVP